jgi:hypothetical protein
MFTYERGGIHVDQCSECRGVFLDRGELERLIDMEAAATPPPAAIADPAAYGPGPGPGYPAADPAAYGPGPWAGRPDDWRGRRDWDDDDDDDDHDWRGRGYRRGRGGILGDIFGGLGD